MEIFVDVVIHKDRGCKDTFKFLFSTFSHGHDIYHANVSDVHDAMVFTGPHGSVYWISETAGISTWTGADFAEADFDYVREVILYAAQQRLVPEKFVEIVNQDMRSHFAGGPMRGDFGRSQMRREVTWIFT